MERPHILLLVVVYLCMTTLHAASDINTARQFGLKLEEFSTSILGIDKLQEHLDSEVQFFNSDLVGQQQVMWIASSLSGKFNARFNAVRALHDAVENNWGAYGASRRFQHCCEVNPQETDYSFKTEVDRNSLCVFGQGYNNSPQKLATNSLLDVMKVNLQQNPSIKWQYLGTEEGVISNYPTFKLCKSEYDPRFRPWYVETTTPVPKDLVIIIDTSGSMGSSHEGRTLMSIAIEAAVTVINTLGPNDRVNVVTFASSARTPPGTSTTSTCYSSELAAATPQNKDYLVSYVKNLRSGSGTQYGLALDKAFDIFDASVTVPMLDNRMRGSNVALEKVILFLTDGEPNDDHSTILQTLSTRNAAHNNSVVVLPFGLGLSSADVGILQDMGQQTGYNAIAGEVKRSNAKWVVDPSNLRSEMASYYDFFIRTGQSPDITVTVPYFDAFGLGLITSACLPVFHQQVHKGVVCVDITISELLSDVTYFQSGYHSYAFIIDNQARLLVHPYLPQPLNVDSEPIFVTMTSLETSPQAVGVMQSMLRLESGNKTFTSLRVTSRGDSVHEGIDESTVLSHYYWHAVEHTKLSVCVVIGDQDQQATITWQDAYPQQLVYHRLDITDADVDTCSHANRKAVKEHSTVKFAPKSFLDPYRYVNEEETANTIHRYVNYLTGASSDNPGFKTGIREYVAATAEFDVIALARGDEAYASAVWTYVGTENGAFRVVPGIQLNKFYDPTQRPWYLRALAQRSATLSTPYEDAFGAGKVVSLSKVLYEGKSNGVHSFNDPVVGVMALDFTVNYFYVLLVQNFPECEANSPGCFVVDSSGFLVMHTDWYRDSPQPEENAHIIKKEPALAKQLIDGGVMTRQSCANYQTLKNQHFFKVYTATAVNLLYGNLFPVSGSNVYVVVKTSPGPASTPGCSCTDSGSTLPDCQRPASWVCECPCQLRTNYYDYCTNLYELNSDTPASCTPTSPSNIVPELTSDSGVSALSQCYSTTCDVSTKLDCLSIHGCTWSDDTCTPDDGANGTGVNTGLAVGLGLGILAVTAIIAFVIYKIKKSANI